MSAPIRRIVPTTLAIAAMAVLVTGCSSGGGSDAPSASRSAASRPSATASAAPSSSATPDAASTGSASGSAPVSTTAAAPAPHAAAGGGTGSSASGRCATSQLHASVADGGGATGSTTNVAIVLKNTSSGTCTLQGWPGISFVGKGNGTQIGNSAVLERSTPHATLTLTPGREVQAVVKVLSAGTWNSATCEPRVIDGFRVIPPGSTQSLFVGATGASFEACANPKVQQLSTSALAAF